uniref:Probable tubulin polyglutamylase TTLL2 n=1 Tax=Geotrypetes seraphini TaxID=260995 RepID=A0A6P8R4E9_GEOSA|nr:probable tubulin polyglutamylase TTLL2 [Geotrypetes seraphini]
MPNWISDEKMMRPLVFRLQDSTPEVIREVLLERGWREFNKNEAEWNLYWGSSFRISDYDSLKPWQRLNHHPGTVRLLRKDSLARHLKRMKAVYGMSHYEFSPVAFILPNDYIKFVSQYSQETILHGRRSSYWICKPIDLSRGRGIFIFHDIKDLTYHSAVIVQKYITNPFLISGYKFDLRIYVCVACFCPLTVYVYQEGLVRFATEKFDLDSLDNIFAHLTNTSINKFGVSYNKGKERVGCGCKWTLSQFRSYLYSLDIDIVLLWQRIHNIVIMTLLAIASQVPPTPNCFELFGFDILIDDTLKPWLLEVNYGPALSLDCSNDVVVKKNLIHDIVELLNYKETDGLGFNGDGEKIDNQTSSLMCNSTGMLKRCDYRQLPPSKTEKFTDVLRNAPVHQPKDALNNPTGVLHRFREDNQSSSVTGHARGNNSKTANCSWGGSVKPPKASQNNLTWQQNFEHTSVENYLEKCPLKKKIVISNKVTRTHPKKTITSKLREKINLPQNSPQMPRNSSQSNPVSRNGEELAPIKPRNIQATFCLPSIEFPKQKLTFPLYFVSNINRKPFRQVGDLVLIFPFNEATLAGSRNGTDVKSIIQEINKLMHRLISIEQQTMKRKIVNG